MKFQGTASRENVVQKLKAQYSAVIAALVLRAIKRAPEYNLVSLVTRVDNVKMNCVLRNIALADISHMWLHSLILGYW